MVQRKRVGRVMPRTKPEKSISLTVRMSKLVHTSLVGELPSWRRVRGPKFSLNDLCIERLSNVTIQPTPWFTHKEHGIKFVVERGK